MGHGFEFATQYAARWYRSRHGARTVESRRTQALAKTHKLLSIEKWM